jgi:CBS domain-containing protein
MKISTILSTKSQKVITVYPDQPVAEAVATLNKHNIGALPVVAEDGQVVGILSERDIVRHLLEQKDILNVLVKALMTTAVITAVPQDDLTSVSHTMTERRFRHLPVLENNKLVGIISIGDIIKAQRDQFRGEIDNLETQILEDSN